MLSVGDVSLNGNADAATATTAAAPDDPRRAAAAALPPAAVVSPGVPSPLASPPSPLSSASPSPTRDATFRFTSSSPSLALPSSAARDGAAVGAVGAGGGRAPTLPGRTAGFDATTTSDESDEDEDDEFNSSAAELTVAGVTRNNTRWRQQRRSRRRRRRSSRGREQRGRRRARGILRGRTDGRTDADSDSSCGSRGLAALASAVVHELSCVNWALSPNSRSRSARPSELPFPSRVRGAAHVATREACPARATRDAHDAREVRVVPREWWPTWVTQRRWLPAGAPCAYAPCAWRAERAPRRGCLCGSVAAVLVTSSGGARALVCVCGGKRTGKRVFPTSAAPPFRPWRALAT